MYEKFFGLAERPFDLTPNPKYLFLAPSHREALSSLDYGIATGVGVTVLVGDAGTGKTTLIRATLESREARKTHAVYLNNPTLTRSEFLEFLAREFHLGPDVAASKTKLLERLEVALRRFRADGVTAALIIDEAQSLPHDLLEEVRLLANIETTTEKLLPIVLAGQPELADRLNQQSLRQLKQRVGLRCFLRPLDLGETGQYITARVRVAGGEASTLFTREAVCLVHERSKGIPRTISVICHNALISGFAMTRRPVAADVVREVCRDFDFENASASLPEVSLRHTSISDGDRDVPSDVASRTQAPTESRGLAGDLFANVFRSRRGFFSSF
ncbi:MAG TPA: AAA family ATPase [Vicinamibacterales bacterium]|nr:AAA family ATPase [Vicinamibacterales bacterium]